MARNSRSQVENAPAAKDRELMQKVADRVYQMMMRDLRIESERQRFGDKIMPLTKRPGGW